MDYLLAPDRDFFAFFKNYFGHRFGTSSGAYRTYNAALNNILSNCGCTQYQAASIILPYKTHAQLDQFRDEFTWDFGTKLGLTAASPVAFLYTYGIINSIRVGSKKLILPKTSNPIFGGITLSLLVVGTYFSGVAAHDNLMKKTSSALLSSYADTKVSPEFLKDYQDLQKTASQL
eukprot:CAMPEP_0114986962 /NCGR_PEP_ID=MMETSP0216-20121206/8722_1 /TAXON_ID=223996 /ORGANISM="Protocruzia adherens, Strain Boccale" /LENGTH=174 /DNA_ID=CAMNT_0002349465 /DNA_START=34 /DNA_END=558 /DNA_ORIENTATION=+